MDTYPHVFFTSPDEWDPSVLDHDPPPLDGLDPSQVLDQPFGDPMFDAYGDYNERIIANLNILLDAPPEDYGSYIANLHQGSSQEPDWNALRPFFAWTSPSSIQDTFNVTTRHGSAPHTQDYIKKHFKSRNPVFIIPRRSEAVATDTIFSDTPAVDDGSTMAQFFCGRDTLVCDAYGIKSTKQFINTLSDNIRKRGAMDTLISDGGKYEISKRVTDLLRSLFIQDYQSEPYHQHQNKAENRFGLAKRYTNTAMNTSGCPAFCWLLCLQYICVVLNHLASPTLQGICPVQALEGTTPDISFLLHFSFYEPVYYRIDSSEPDLNFPSSSNEKKGYWVGFADNQGDSLTWRILTEDTQKIIIRSGVRSALRTTTNQRLASPSGDRIPSTTPGAEPPRDARDSGSARSHSTHLETSSSDRPKWSPTRSSTRYQDQISVTCTRWTLRMPSFTRATHAQPSLSNFTRRDSNFGERTRSRRTTLGERNFPTSPQNKKTKLTHCSIYVPMRTISTSHAK